MRCVDSDASERRREFRHHPMDQDILHEFELHCIHNISHSVAIQIRIHGCEWVESWEQMKELLKHERHTTMKEYGQSKLRGVLTPPCSL